MQGEVCTVSGSPYRYISDSFCFTTLYVIANVGLCIEFLKIVSMEWGFFSGFGLLLVSSRDTYCDCSCFLFVCFFFFLRQRYLKFTGLLLGLAKVWPALGPTSPTEYFCFAWIRIEKRKTSFCGVRGLQTKSWSAPATTTQGTRGGHGCRLWPAGLTDWPALIPYGWSPVTDHCIET